jgi:glycogen synthase
VPRRRPRSLPQPDERRRLRVLYVAPDLDESVTGFASALAAHVDVTVVAPLASDLDPGRLGLARRLRPLAAGAEAFALHEGALPSGRGRLWLVEGARDAAALARAALAAASAAGWPDVVHAHDARTAAALVHVRAANRATATVLGARGDTAPADALAAADRIVAPSPQQARALRAAPAWSAAADRIVGFLDGLDPTRWDPRRDTALPARFDADDLTGKAESKAALQRELGLAQRPRDPLLVAIEPSAELAGAAAHLAEAGAQIAASGAAVGVAIAKLASLAARLPLRIAVRDGDDALAHRLLGAADFFAAPAGGGMRRLAGMRYGAVPIVAGGSGFDDVVVDFDPASLTGSGFVHDGTEAGLRAAVSRAARVYGTPAMDALVARVMAVDLSWRSAAARYAGLYESLTSAAPD